MDTLLLKKVNFMNWIFSDPHACYDKLDNLLSKIKEKDKDAKIHCGGDLCDRGTNTKGVIQRVIDEGILCVRGNHDVCFDAVINNKMLVMNREVVSPIQTLQWFANYGMDDAFISYGLSRNFVGNCINNGELEPLRNAIPDSHKKFLTNLPLYMEMEDFFIIHAYLPINKSPNYSTYNEEQAIWGRFTKDEIKEPKDWTKKGYFGHTPTWNYGNNGIVFGDKIALIDTGASMGGVLTAICHETQEVITSH